jgi:MoaA/NifB/PqqE/SkfB family radical SAM enzyme
MFIALKGARLEKSGPFFHTLESKLIRRPPGPSTVVFSMTKACTYKCPHCYQHKDGGPDLPGPLLIDTAKKLQDVGVALFDIEGGAPFLKYDRLLELVRALDERSEIWINTTGAHMTQARFDALVDEGLSGLMVSIHSPDPERHDAFTGIPGSFDMAVEALRLCRRRNRSATINCVMAEDEIREGGLDRIMDLAKEHDCDFVQLIHPKPAGAWMGRCEGMQREEPLIRETQDVHRRYNRRSSRAYPALAAQVMEESHGALGCTAGGVDRFYVNATGEVQPCEFLNFSFGNVREEPFEEIFRRMRSYFPVPCSDWLCCTLGGAIADLIREKGIERTPVVWEHARELVESMHRGEPTPLYERMGIYR